MTEPSSSASEKEASYHVRLIQRWNHAGGDKPELLKHTFFGLHLELHGINTSPSAEPNEVISCPLQFDMEKSATSGTTALDAQQSIKMLQAMVGPFQILVLSKLAVESTTSSEQKRVLQQLVTVQPGNRLLDINGTRFLQQSATGQDVHTFLQQVLNRISLARPFELLLQRHNHAQAASKIVPFAMRSDVQAAQVAQYLQMQEQDAKLSAAVKQKKQFLLQQMDYERETYLNAHIGDQLAGLYDTIMANGQWQAYEFERALWYYHATENRLFAEHPMRNSEETRALIGTVQFKTRFAAQKLQYVARQFLRRKKLIHGTVDIGLPEQIWTEFWQMTCDLVWGRGIGDFYDAISPQIKVQGPGERADELWAAWLAHQAKEAQQMEAQRLRSKLKAAVTAARAVAKATPAAAPTVETIPPEPVKTFCEMDTQTLEPTPREMISTGVVTESVSVKAFSTQTIEPQLVTKASATDAIETSVFATQTESTTSVSKSMMTDELLSNYCPRAEIGIQTMDLPIEIPSSPIQKAAAVVPEKSSSTMATQTSARAEKLQPASVASARTTDPHHEWAPFLSLLKRNLQQKEKSPPRHHSRKPQKQQASPSHFSLSSSAMNHPQQGVPNYKRRVRSENYDEDLGDDDTDPRSSSYNGHRDVSQLGGRRYPGSLVYVAPSNLAPSFRPARKDELDEELLANAASHPSLPTMSLRSTSALVRCESWLAGSTSLTPFCSNAERKSQPSFTNDVVVGSINGIGAQLAEPRQFAVMGRLRSDAERRAAASKSTPTGYRTYTIRYSSSTIHIQEPDEIALHQQEKQAETNVTSHRDPQGHGKRSTLVRWVDSILPSKLNLHESKWRTLCASIDAPSLQPNNRQAAEMEPRLRWNAYMPSLSLRTYSPRRCCALLAICHHQSPNTQ